MKAIGDLLVYYFTILVQHILRLLPRTSALWVGRKLGLLTYHLGIRRSTVLGNLRIAFPEKSEEELRAIARNIYRNMGMNAVEFLILPWISEEQFWKHVSFKNEEYLSAAQAQGHGAVLVGAHFGNWEYLAVAIRMKMKQLDILIGKQHNHLIDALYNRVHQSQKVGWIYKGGSLKPVLSLLQKGQTVAILPDQDAKRHGIFLPFFNKPASSHTGPALFAVLSGAPMLYGEIIRQPNGDHICIMDPPFEVPDTLSQEEKVKYLTIALFKRYERAITEHPDHWFWFHRRWKTQPKNNQ